MQRFNPDKFLHSGCFSARELLFSSVSAVANTSELAVYRRCLSVQPQKEALSNAVAIMFAYLLSDWQKLSSATLVIPADCAAPGSRTLTARQRCNCIPSDAKPVKLGPAGPRPKIKFTCAFMKSHDVSMLLAGLMIMRLFSQAQIFLTSSYTRAGVSRWHSFVATECLSILMLS